MKKELVIRPAWQVEEPDPDPDVVGIYLDDKIIIPEEIKDPPILRTMEQMKKRRTGHAGRLQPGTETLGSVQLRGSLSTTETENPKSTGSESTLTGQFFCPKNGEYLTS